MPQPLNHSETTTCCCLAGSTYGTDDPAVRLCDLCGGVVPTDPVTGEYEDAKPVQQKTIPVPADWLLQVASLLNIMAGEGISIDDCADPAHMMFDLAQHLGVWGADDVWAATVQALKDRTNG